MINDLLCMIFLMLTEFLHYILIYDLMFDIGITYIKAIRNLLAESQLVKRSPSSKVRNLKILFCLNE